MLFALVMSIPFCRITPCPIFIGIKYTFNFADKRTGKKSDAKNTGWLTRGGRASSQSGYTTKANNPRTFADQIFLVRGSTDYRSLFQIKRKYYTAY